MKIIISFLFSILLFSCSLLTESTHSYIKITPVIESSSRSFSRNIIRMELTVTGYDMETITEVSNNNSLDLDVPKGENRTFNLTITLDNSSVFYGTTTKSLIHDIEDINIVLKGLLNTLTIDKRLTNGEVFVKDIYSTIHGNTIYIGLPEYHENGVVVDKSALKIISEPTGASYIVSNNGDSGTLSYIQDGITSTYDLKFFNTYTPTLIDKVSLGSAPSEMEPGLDSVNGTLYLTYTDINDNPIVKKYNPPTGVFSNNIFNMADAPTSPRYFKIFGHSNSDIYFAYQSGKILSVYHYNGSIWSLKTTHTTERDDLSLTVLNNNLYLAEGHNTAYKIFRYDPLNSEGFKPVLDYPIELNTFATCITNSLLVPAPDKMYISFRSGNNLITKKIEGNTQPVTMSIVDRLSSKPEAIHSSYIDYKGNLVLDILDENNNSMTVSQTNNNQLIPLGNDELLSLIRSFENNNNSYRVVYGLNKISLQTTLVSDFDTTIWSIPHKMTQSMIKKVKVLNVGDKIYSIFINTSNSELYFIDNII